jgi:rfaE bifunctional protein kinase chain/domain
LSELDFKELFEQFRRMKVMVVGDVMVDSYIFGKVERISPEAPVPVVQVERRMSRLGGAANVALNIKAMGAEPVLCSVIGNDSRGQEFMQLLKEEGISASGIYPSNKRITTTKFRVIGNRSQMLRVDEEMTHDLDKHDQSVLLQTITEILERGNIKALVFQDYNKGILTPFLIRKVTEKAIALGIPVAVDPKQKNFMVYRGVTLFKPNLKELREGINKDIRPENITEMDEAAAFFHHEQGHRIVMTTLSEKGVYISHLLPDGQAESKLIPAHVRNIADVSGAGDTVISVAALCLGCGVAPFDTAAISNLAGGLVCEEIGVVPVQRGKLLNEVMDKL